MKGAYDPNDWYRLGRISYRAADVWNGSSWETWSTVSWTGVDTEAYVNEETYWLRWAEVPTASCTLALMAAVEPKYVYNIE